MTWTLDEVVLPIPPAKMSKRTIRENKIVAVIDDFPNPNLNQPTRFELEISGLIWPRALAISLDEKTRNAEDNMFVVTLSGTDAESAPWISGTYALTRSDVSVDGPMYTGNNEEVFEYKLTLTQYASAGVIEPGEEGGADNVFDDLVEDVGFDSDGNGKINGEELFNWMTNILTFGVFK